MQHQVIGGGAPIALPPRLAQFMRMVDTLDSNEIGAAVDALIERLDAADGDPDLEDGDEDRCLGGDDEIIAGPVERRGLWLDGRTWWHDSVGNEDDAESGQPPAYMIDQSRDLFVTPANDEAGAVA